MRNPAPVVLSLILAAAALFLILRQPDAPSDPPTADTPGESVETTPEAATPETDEPEPSPEQEVVVGEENTTPTLPAPSAAAHSWPHRESDIEPDAKAVFGTLENGFRYIILPNAEPPENLSLRLHIAAGSLMEAEDQRGLAHFLEHMVFNGSKNFTPAELVPRMQRLGIAFGAHVNAYTSFDETVYMLNLPDQSADTMKLGFTVMRDFCDGALLKEEEIDRERGVILSEKTSRDSVDYRMMQRQFSELLPDSLLTRRFPIGEEEVIKNAPRERFVDFYRRYYTPERMTFIVVGDADPKAMEAKIRETFSSLVQPEDAGDDPDLGSLTAVEGLQPAVFADKESSETSLGLLKVEAFEPLPDTTETRAAKIPLSVAHSILALRFNRLAKEEGSPILGGSAWRDELFNFVTLGSIDLSVADDRWQDSVAVLEQEFRRALEYGFTAAELAEAKANLLNAYQQAVQTADTRRSENLATAIARTINSNRVLTHPETDLEIIQSSLEELDVQDCHEAFKAFWEDRNMHLILTTKVAPSEAKETLISLYEASSSSPVDPPKKEEALEFAYKDFGEPGSIESRESIDDLGITQIRLSNGVAINLKPTDFEKNSITLSARIGAGRLTMPTDKPGLAEFATAVIEGGGIGEHSADDLQRIFAGKNIGFGFSVGEDAFQLRGRTTPEDFGLQMEAMAAQITRPGYRAEAVTQFHKQVPMLYQQLKHTAAGPMQKMGSWLKGDDPRFRFPDGPEPFLSYTAEDVKPWLEREFTGGPIELSIVGDFDPDAILPDLLRTFGALPAATATDPISSAARQVAFPEAPQTKTFTYESKIPKGRAILLWKTEGLRKNEERFRRLNMLAAILRDRLREEIREKLGASYSPEAGVDGSAALEDFGYAIAISIGTPEDIERLIEVSESLAADLAANGASDDELDRARKPALSSIEKSLRENSYWLSSVLSGSQEDSRRLELARNRKSDVESITLDEINEMAAAYLSPENALRVIIKSEAAAGADE